MKNPNGYGSVHYLGKRRHRPWRVRVTKGYKLNKQGEYIPEYITLGYTRTKAEGLQLLAEYNKKPYDVDNRKLTFSDCFNKLYPTIGQSYESENGKEKAQKSAMNYFRKCWKIHDIKIIDLRHSHLQEVVDDYAADFSEESLLKIKKLIRDVFQWALKEDIIEKDYSEFISCNSKKKKKEKNIFSIQECDIIEQLSNEGIFEFQAVHFLLYTGMRIGELRNLKSKDIHLQERYIDVYGTKTKSSNRKVPIHRNIESLLKRWIKSETEYLFTFNYTERPAESSYSRLISAALREKGIEHTAHECRHTFITYADKSGIGRLRVKRIVGHSSDDVTENVYTHELIETLIHEIDKYSIS